MALTAEDVVNKRFQPTKFREGYDQDEVDDFLDEIVIELRRLNQENEELRQRLIAGESRIAELQRSGASSQSAPQAAAPAVVAEPAPVAVESAPEPAPVVAPAPTPAPAAAVPASVPGLPFPTPSLDINAIDPSNTNNLLQLARRLHEDHVREGIEKRDALIAEGHATASRTVQEAEAKQRQQINSLDQERALIEHRIDELRTFEREYRQKLRGYIEGQLSELDGSVAGGSAPQSAAQQPASSFGAPSGSYQGFGGN